MKIIENQRFDEERALYESDGIYLKNCRFDGEADGESAFKESKNIITEECFFNLRYPFWHCNQATLEKCEMTVNCRAPFWYTEGIHIKNSILHGVKAMRECRGVDISECDIISTEFGWSTGDMKISDSKAEGEYFMLRAENIELNNVEFKGKYSFQYVKNVTIENSYLDTKDAFWHAKNIVVRNSTVKGEYLAWYCENVTFENCTIIGTQPLCYCQGLKLINCKMIDCDLSFEKSDVEADIIGDIVSVKNVYSGYVRADSIGEIIVDDERAEGMVEIKEKVES